MKNLRFLFLLPVVLIFTSCFVKETSKSKTSLPPGQAKKVAGTQSAKPFAPGQQKHWHILWGWPLCYYLASVVSLTFAFWSLFSFLSHAKSPWLNTKEAIHALPQNNRNPLCFSASVALQNSAKSPLQFLVCETFASPAIAGQVCVYCSAYV